jgi:Raf kinase inhibitor-like YbhB/YbcL family protein
MRGTLLAVMFVALLLLVGGCSQTPELQGAEIVTPPIASPVVQPTAVEGTAIPPTAAPPTDVPQQADSPSTALALESPDFGAGDVIPTRFACDGENISPELAWVPMPEGTLSYALIMDDPDAPGGTWVHWVIYNMPADQTGLPEKVPPDAELADGTRQGTNSGKDLGYAGPCPPGETHRYFFKLYALDQVLELPSGATADELTAAMAGHIIDQAELMGTYTRN